MTPPWLGLMNNNSKQFVKVNEWLGYLVKNRAAIDKDNFLC